jgi:DNA modification methylase
MSLPPYYEDATSTIYHGDALEVLPQLQSSSVGIVLTDPPFIIGAVSAGNMASKAGGWADMMNSALWFSAWYREVDRLMHRTGAMWTCCNWRSLPVVMRAASDCRMPVTSVAVWDKQWIGPGGSQGLRPSYEMVALLAHPDFTIEDRGTADIFRCQVGSYKGSGHPAEKPERLFRDLLRCSISGVERPLVLDPFMGSGTTLAAASVEGVKAIGIEAEERWCEYAARRLSQEVLDLGESA